MVGVGWPAKPDDVTIRIVNAETLADLGEANADAHGDACECRYACIACDACHAYCDAWDGAWDAWNACDACDADRATKAESQKEGAEGLETSEFFRR
jgi:hypothetical protein